MASAGPGDVANQASVHAPQATSSAAKTPKARTRTILMCPPPRRVVGFGGGLWVSGCAKIGCKLGKQVALGSLAWRSPAPRISCRAVVKLGGSEQRLLHFEAEHPARA